jgi:hypothetical protein
MRALLFEGVRVGVKIEGFIDSRPPNVVCYHYSGLRRIDNFLIFYFPSENDVRNFASAIKLMISVLVVYT